MLVRTRNEFSRCYVPTFLRYFFHYVENICDRGEGLGITTCLNTVVGGNLGITTCLNTVVGGNQGHAPCDVFLLHNVSFVCQSDLTDHTTACKDKVKSHHPYFWGYCRI